jgi:hypothetical protein
MLTTFLVPADVLDLLTDESKADAYLVSIVKTALAWEDGFRPSDITEDAQRALAILARRARDRMALPSWEVR